MAEHVNLIGVSGGKDSTALLLWAVHESGYDVESIAPVFCDTGNEAQETYDYIHMLSERVCPIRWLVPELDFFALARKKGRFPDRRARFCTQQLKMLPTQRFVLDLLEQEFEVLSHSGVRAEESAERASLSEREFDTFLGCDVYRPLLRWSITDVWEAHDRYGIPPNPLYALGCKRVGCLPCINSVKSEIRVIAKEFPERIDRIRDAENDTEKGPATTFFTAKTTPRRFCSRSVTTKDGRSVPVPTVDDVVRWSQTAHGGRTPFIEIDDNNPTCDSRSGMCE